jgi:hypothetical protein
MQKKLSKKKLNNGVLGFASSHKLNENSLMLKEFKELSEELQHLDEATWGERLKYYAAKWLPSYKVGDKILGGEEERQKMLGQIQAIIDQEQKDGQNFIKGLDSRFKQTDFPNNLEKKDFLEGVLEISAVYDTIKKAVDDGKIKPAAANIFIDNLRKYVNYMMSYKLNRTIYSTMNETYDESEDIQLGEATLADVNADGGLSSDSVRRALGRDRDARGGAAGYNEYDSEVMKGLKSNRLPLTLAIGGAILTAAGWVGQSQWFIDYIKGLTEISKSTFETTTKTIIERNIKVDPNGFSYTLQNNLPPNKLINLNFNQPIENLRKALEFYGEGDVSRGIKATSLFIDPSQRAESVSNLVKQLADPSNRTVGDVFNTAEGTYGRAGTLFSQYGGAPGVLAKFITTRIVTRVITNIFTTAGAVVGTALIGAASYLLPIGLSALVAGAVVKGMRVKGQTSSRAATLNALLQSLRPLPEPSGPNPNPTPPNPNPTPPNPTPPNPTPPNPNPIPGPGPNPNPTNGGGQGGQYSNVSGDNNKVFQQTVYITLADGAKWVGDTFNIQGDNNKIDNSKDNSRGNNRNNKRSKKKVNIKSGGKNSNINVKTEDLQYNSKIDSFKQTNKNNVTLINDFQVNADLLNKFAKSVDSLSETNNVKSNKKLLALIKKVKSNPFHSLIINITSIMENNIKNKKLILNFIKTYMDILTNSKLSLKDVLKEATKANARQESSKIIDILKSNFQTYLKDIINLLKLLNTIKKPEGAENAKKSNIGRTGNFVPTASASKSVTSDAPKPAEPAQDDIYTRANMGSSLEESKKRKLK